MGTEMRGASKTDQLGQMECSPGQTINTCHPDVQEMLVGSISFPVVSRTKQEANVTTLY